MAKDILLDENLDLSIQNGDLNIGESLTQDVGLILKSNKGEWKQYPLLGCNLVELIRSKANQNEINKRVMLQMKYDGKDYNEIKNGINLSI